MQFICINSWNINYTLEVLRIIYKEQGFFFHWRMYTVFSSLANNCIFILVNVIAE